MDKSILLVKTLCDSQNNLTYVVTKYSDNSASVKIYEKDIQNDIYKYIKTLKLNSLLAF